MWTFLPILQLFYIWITEDETEDEGTTCRNKTEQGTESSSSYQFVKRQRRRTSSRDRARSISVTVTTFDYSSSGDETIYSAQGKIIFTIVNYLFSTCAILVYLPVSTVFSLFSRL